MVEDERDKAILNSKVEWQIEQIKKLQKREPKSKKLQKVIRILHKVIIYKTSTFINYFVLIFIQHTLSGAHDGWGLSGLFSYFQCFLVF